VENIISIGQEIFGTTITDDKDMDGSSKRKLSEAPDINDNSKKKSKVSNSVENTDLIYQDEFKASTIINSELSPEKIGSTKRKVSEGLACDVRSSKKSKVSNSVENTDSIGQEMSSATTPEKNEMDVEMIGSSKIVEFESRESKNNSDELSVILIEREIDEGNRGLTVEKDRSKMDCLGAFFLKRLVNFVLNLASLTKSILI
jgi:hypothetical protein